MTTSCWLSIAALALGATAAGCGGDDSSDDSTSTTRDRAAAACSGDAGELRASFRRLPKGLRYRPLPEDVERQAESRLDERFAGFDGRQIVRGGRPYAAMTVYVVREEIDDVEDHLAGFADGFSEDAKTRTVDLGGAEGLRIDGAEQSAVVRVFDKCRVVSVIAGTGDTAEEIARTVLA